MHDNDLFDDKTGRHKDGLARAIGCGRGGVPRFVVLAAVSGALVISAAASAQAASNGAADLPQADPGPPQFTTIQGAKPLRTDKTIPYWHGQFTDPTNGVTYGYNMVGADPAAQTSTTVPVDLIPLNFVFAGDGDYALNGSDVIPKILASPIFQPADYSTTPAVTGAADSAGHVPVVPGGELSLGNTGVQYEDAVMRSQFDKVGTSYHLRLGQPTVWPTVTVTIPQSLGGVFRNRRGVVWGEQNDNQAFFPILNQLHLDPTHLWILVTNNVFLGTPTKGCCALGFHTATRYSARGGGDTSGQGAQPIPTWAYVAYLQPGTYNPLFDPLLSDVNVLSHEIAEWGDDPFANNYVNPWSTPQSPQYGCVPVLEVGDPVVAANFAMPGNSYDTGPYADGYWHLQDEAFLPWMARQSPNTTSQSTQSPSAPGGRYTFMGDLNPYPGFHQPATGC